MELYPLSRFAIYQNEFVTIEDAQEYKRVTAKLHTKGIVLRDIVKGFELKTKRQQICKANQLLVAEIDAKVGGYGIVPKELEDAIVSSHYFLFNVKANELMPEYLGYVLKTNEFFSQINAQGSTNYAAIRPKDVLQIVIPYCSIDLQRNLVRKLNSVNSQDALLSRNLSKEKEYVIRLRQTIIQEAISGKLVPQDSNDEPASELLRKIKAEKEKLIKEKKSRERNLARLLLPIKEEVIPYELPKGWEWVRLGQICEFVYGAGLKKEDTFPNGKYPVFGSNGIIGYYDEYLTKERAIIIGRKGSSGALNISEVPSWTTDVAYYVEETQYLDFRFMFYLLKSLNLEKLGKGIKPGLNRNEVYNLVLGLPPLSEQKRIVKKVDQSMKLCDELEEKVKENQKNFLLLMEAVLKETFTS